MLAMLAYDPNTNPLNSNEWAFPLVECFHLVSFAFSIGMITLVDLRLLGVGFKRQSAAQLVKDTSIWTLLGLVVVIISGLLIFSSDPVHYYYNGSFRVKVTMLLIGIIFNYTIHNRAASPTFSPGAAKLVGAASLVIWVSVVAGGIFIAFI